MSKLRARQEVERLEAVVARRQQKMADTQDEDLRAPRMARSSNAQRTLMRARERLAGLYATP